MNIEITDSAKEKLLLMKEKNMPITLMKYPVGWAGFKYKIVSAKQTEDDNLYNVEMCIRDRKIQGLRFCLSLL